MRFMQPGKEIAEGDLTAVSGYSQGGGTCREDRDRLITEVHGRRTRDNGYDLK